MNSTNPHITQQPYVRGEPPTTDHLVRHYAGATPYGMLWDYASANQGMIYQQVNSTVGHPDDNHSMKLLIGVAAFAVFLAYGYKKFS